MHISNTIHYLHVFQGLSSAHVYNGPITVGNHVWTFTALCDGLVTGSVVPREDSLAETEISSAMMRLAKPSFCAADARSA
jgi:hypothetical protein